MDVAVFFGLAASEPTVAIASLEKGRVQLLRLEWRAHAQNESGLQQELKKSETVDS